MTKPEIRKYVGDKIRLLRFERRISQSALAKAIGMSAANMSCIETYKTSITLEVLIVISKYFEVKVSDLLPPEV